LFQKHTQIYSYTSLFHTDVFNIMKPRVSHSVSQPVSRRRSSAVRLSFRRLSVRQPAVELLPEGVQQVRDGLLHTDVPLQLCAQRRHPFTHNAARHHVAEPRHVGVAVQSQAVRRHEVAAVDSCKETLRGFSRRTSTLQLQEAELLQCQLFHFILKN